MTDGVGGIWGAGFWSPAVGLRQDDVLQTARTIGRLSRFGEYRRWFMFQDESRFTRRGSGR